MKILNTKYNKSFSTKINLATVSFYLIYVIYGYYGALTGGSITQQIIFTSLILVIQLVIGLISWRFSEKFKINIKITINEIILFFLLLVFFISVTVDDLNMFLVGDELSYSQSAILHGDKFSLLISNYLDVNDIPFKYLLHVSLLFLLLSNIIIVYLFQKLRWTYRIILMIFLLIVSRYIVFYFGGSNSVHPPLNHLTTLIITSLFGVSNFTFKVSYLIGYVFFVFLISKKIKNIFSTFETILIVFSISTIPLLLRLSTTVEQSLWTSLSVSYLLIYIVCSKKINYYFVCFVITVGAMMRLPTILIVVPVLMIFLKNIYSKEITLKKGVIPFSLLIIVIPFFIYTLLVGAPSLDSADFQESFLSNITLAISSGIIYISTLNSINIWWLIFLPFAFFPLDKKLSFFNLAYFTYFILAVLLYYSIRYSLWGEAKYQAEYIIPFLIVGYILLLRKLNKKIIVVSISTLLISLNIYSYYSYPKGNVKNDELIGNYDIQKELYSGYRGMIHLVFEYEKAYDYVKELKLSDYSYSPGLNYGILPEIISGYSFSEVKKIIETRSRINALNNLNNIPWTNADATLINKIDQIKILIIGNVYNKKYLIEDLDSKGWEKIKTFENTKYGSSVVVMQKN